MRRYVDQNLLQPYVDGRSRDARFWVTLGLSADHADVLAFIGAYVREQIMRAFGPDGAVNTVEIHRILGAEHIRWLETSNARLRQFGYTAVTF